MFRRTNSLEDAKSCICCLPELCWCPVLLCLAGNQISDVLNDISCPLHNGLLSIVLQQQEDLPHSPALQCVFRHAQSGTTMIICMHQHILLFMQCLTCSKQTLHLTGFCLSANPTELHTDFDFTTPTNCTTGIPPMQMTTICKSACTHFYLRHRCKHLLWKPQMGYEAAFVLDARELGLQRALCLSATTRSP